MREPRWTTSLTGRMLRRFGLELVPAWRREQLEFEIHLRALFARLEIDTVLDVGANRGQYRDFLRYQVGYEGDIVSFEPIPEIAARLEERARQDPKWRVLCCALGSADGQADFNVARSDQLSSFLPADHRNVRELTEKNVVVRTIPVKLRRLASVISDLGLARKLAWTYLKMDTQGFDLEVMAGAGPWVEQFAALQSEVACLRIYQGAPELHESLQRLGAYGYEITGMFPVNRERHLRVIDFDCVMVNARRAGAD
ncbi:MAG TPA: FkbM family methyltransferase [Burkholderiales bacterium]|nr:FkbM family methyltransferase [Burkholderiales bacterium]